MRLAAVRIFVDDLPLAVAHYRRLFGDPTEIDDIAGFAVFGADRAFGTNRAGDGDEARVVIEAVAGDAPSEQRRLVGRLTGISFAVDDIADTSARLQARGVAFSSPPVRDARGGTSATVVDPAGNEVQLVEYPVEPWRNTKVLVDHDPPHAVEQLVFEVRPEAFERWRQADFELWTLAEADQFPDFLSKEVWVQPGEMYTVVVVIHWTTLASWKSVDMGWVAAQEARFSALIGADNYRLIDAPHERGEQFYKVSDYR